MQGIILCKSKLTYTLTYNFTPGSYFFFPFVFLYISVYQCNVTFILYVMSIILNIKTFLSLSLSLSLSDTMRAILMQFLTIEAHSDLSEVADNIITRVSFM